MDKWIRVEDGLPKERGLYLVYIPSVNPLDNYSYEVAYFHIIERDEVKRSWFEIEGIYDYNNYITHWMTLPEPPESTCRKE